MKKELQDAEKTLRDMATRVEQLRSNAAASRQKRDEAKSSNAQNTSQGAVLDSLMKLKATGQIQGFHVSMISLTRGFVLMRYIIGTSRKLGYNSRRVRRSGYDGG